MLQELDTTFVVVRGRTLPNEADAFRDKILKTCIPRLQRRKSHSVVHTLAAVLFNGDWRSGVVSHHCAGCCKDAADSKSQALQHMPALLLALRFKMFSRSDWRLWADALVLVAFLSGMHGLFGRCFLRAFSSWAAAEVPEANADVDDATLLYRAELSKNAKLAVEFWAGAPEWRVHLLMVALFEQRHVMHSILGLTSLERDHLNAKHKYDTGTCL